MVRCRGEGLTIRRMRIRELLGCGRPCISFEFFPPKNEEGLASLRESIARLRDLRPSFVSVTYGAGGSTRDRTIELVSQIRREYGIEAMAHLTCVGASRDERRGWRTFWRCGAIRRRVRRRSARILRDSGTRMSS
jgi:5,10-methylenetetrahydrofolate reductase